MKFLRGAYGCICLLHVSTYRLIIATHFFALDVNNDMENDSYASPRAPQHTPPRGKKLPSALSSGDTKVSPLRRSVESTGSAQSSNSGTGRLSPRFADGENWVQFMMEIDPEEDKMAQMYETGFQMFMVEKGILPDDKR